MVKSDVSSTVSAAPVSAAALVGKVTLPRPPAALSRVALAAAAEQPPTAYSPIVVAGCVRAIEGALIAFIGTAIYSLYVVRQEGFYWHYAAAIAGIAALAVFAFQRDCLPPRAIGLDVKHARF